MRGRFRSAGEHARDPGGRVQPQWHRCAQCAARPRMDRRPRHHRHRHQIDSPTCDRPTAVRPCRSKQHQPRRSAVRCVDVAPWWLLTICSGIVVLLWVSAGGPRLNERSADRPAYGPPTLLALSAVLCRCVGPGSLDGCRGPGGCLSVLSAWLPCPVSRHCDIECSSAALVVSDDQHRADDCALVRGRRLRGGRCRCHQHVRQRCELGSVTADRLARGRVGPTLDRTVRRGGYLTRPSG